MSNQLCGILPGLQYCVAAVNYSVVTTFSALVSFAEQGFANLEQKNSILFYFTTFFFS